MENLTPPTGEDMVIAAVWLESVPEPPCHRVAVVLRLLAPLADKMAAGDMAGAMADIVALQGAISAGNPPNPPLDAVDSQG